MIKYCDNYLDPCNTVITAEVAEFYNNKGQDRQYCIKCLTLRDDTGAQMFGRMPMSGFGQDVWGWITSLGGVTFDDKTVQQVMCIAQKHGLAKIVAYDIEKHGVRNVIPGDNILVPRSEARNNANFT